MKNHRTLERPTYPFAVAEDALRECAIRLDNTKDFDPAVTTIDLEPLGSDGPAPIVAEVKFDYECDHVCAETRLAENEMRLVVVEEHPLSRRTVVRDDQPLGALPGKVREYTIGAAEYGDREVNLRLAVVLGDERHRDGPRAWRPSSVLSERSFTIRRPESKSLFRVENQSFRESGWDPDAIWFCDIKEPETAAEYPPEEVVSVYLNSDWPAVNLFWEPASTRDPHLRATAKITRCLVLGGILSEIALAVLRAYAVRSEREAVSIVQGSMLDRMKTNLEKALGVELAELSRRAMSDPGVVTRQIQQLVKCGPAFDQEVIVGLKQLGEGSES